MLALLVLGYGTSLVVKLGLGAFPADFEIGQYVLFVAWPVTMILVAAFGTSALFAARRERQIGRWWVV